MLYGKYAEFIDVSDKHASVLMVEARWKIGYVPPKRRHHLLKV
jgi:hypothetical protein